MVEAADHLQVLGPGQVLVDRRVLAGEADLGPQLRRFGGDVEPGDPGAAAVGGSSVVRMRTAVLLPAPLGPSRPSTVPDGTRRSIPSSACTFP
ncbi:MAG TPA: hypothetical protein VHM66_13850 [Solirubrobacterales bacterium]|nr:hypothetical protein [Solirubrobacterales bacterium]